jgi:alcohol dehydrogenase
LRLTRAGRRALKRKGAVHVRATAGFDPTEDIRFIWTFELQILGSNGWARDDVTALLRMVAAGELRAVIDHIFPLEEVPEALARLERRLVFGKLVVTP